MTSPRSILKKEIWSRQTDKRIAWWVTRILLLVFLIYAGLAVAIWSVGFVGSKWFTKFGRQQTQGWLDRAQKLRSGSAEEARKGNTESLDMLLNDLHRDTVLDFMFESKGQALVSSAATCRETELAVARFPASLRRDKLNEFKSKVCAEYEHQAQSLREELKTTPTFRF